MVTNIQEKLLDLLIKHLELCRHLWSYHICI